MFEKIRVSIWEWFVYFLSGFLGLISIVVSFNLNGDINIYTYIDKVRGVDIFILILLLILIGKLIEPFANLFDKAISYLAKKCVFISAILGDSSNNKWMKEITDQYVPLIKKKVPEEFSSDEFVFRWAKDFLIQQDLNSDGLIFLTRYGFYRSVAFILFSTGVVYMVNNENFIVGLILIVASFVYRFRSGNFYVHLNQSVYNNFLVAKYIDKSGVNE